jgi:hypothetical protein
VRRVDAGGDGVCQEGRRVRPVTPIQYGCSEPLWTTARTLRRARVFRMAWRCRSSVTLAQHASRAGVCPALWTQSERRRMEPRHTAGEQASAHSAVAAPRQLLPRRSAYVRPTPSLSRALRTSERKAGNEPLPAIYSSCSATSGPGLCTETYISNAKLLLRQAKDKVNPLDGCAEHGHPA